MIVKFYEEKSHKFNDVVVRGTVGKFPDWFISKDI